MPRLRRPASALAFLLLAAGCGSTSTRPDPGPRALTPATAQSVGARGERIELPMGPAYREVALLEDQRTLGETVDGTPRLLALLRAPDEGVRARAARALGRFEYPRFGRAVTDALGRALEDPLLAVRLEAAFALGQRRDPAAAPSLLAYLQDPEPRLRARVAEAAAKLEGDALHRELLLALKDEDPLVRIEVADGAALWDPDAPDADEVDRALLEALVPRDERDLPLSPDQVAPELRWHLLHALARRRAPSARGAFLDRLDSSAPLDRLFAAMGLGRLQRRPDAETGVADREATALLGELLTGTAERGPEPDWRVAVEACVALGAIGDAAALPALVRASQHPSTHVRTTAVTAIGALRADDEDVLGALRRAQVDLSRSVRAATLQAIASRVSTSQALALLEPMARSDDFVERGLAASALAAVDSAEADALLLELVEDPLPFVASRAAEALGAHDLERVRPALRELLASGDNGIRLAAVVALAREPVEADAPALIEAIRTSSGEVSTEVAFTALRALAQAGGPLARAIHLEAARDPRPHVRRVAAEGLAEAFGQLPPATDAPALGLSGEVALPGRDFPRWTHDPMVEVVTSKGRMVFELLPAEAPAHVHSFLELAQRGAYDGLHFHRVVPDFVVQGGDPRGDGNGGRPARGEALRAEFTPRSFRRGALGTPRNEDPDSGGAQLFVTHRPTPHLDGRYTQFGLLREGLDVLDGLEVGDRILRVRLLE